MTTRRIAITAVDCYAADAPMPGDLDAPGYAERVPFADWFRKEDDEQQDDMADVFEDDDDDDLDEDDTDDAGPFDEPHQSEPAA